MTRHVCRTASACVAATSVLASALAATAAGAQQYDQPQPPPGYGQPQAPADQPQSSYDQSSGYYQPPPQGGYQGSYQGYYSQQPEAYPNAPPGGQYAEPPPTAGQPYDANAYQADQVYAQQYSAWAARYCVDRRRNNAAAGALIGGLLGAGVGAAAGGGRGAAIGGAVGAGTGAAVGASEANACPPGYVVRAGAPRFAYAPPPAYVGSYYPGPAWYRPWIWEGGRWVYYPYRSWYWSHRGYWRR